MSGPSADSAESLLVYSTESHTVKRLKTFLLKNRGCDDLIVKTFSLYGGNTRTGPWTIALDHATANLSAGAREFPISNTLPKFQFWKLLLLENNGCSRSRMCKFVLEMTSEQPPVPQCSVCGGLGCPITDPVLFPASNSAASSSSSTPSSSSSSSSSCRHVVCRGCYRHIASVATLTMLRERALVAVSTSTSGDTTGSRCRGKQVNNLPPSALGSQPGTTQRGRDSSSPSVISVQCPVAGCGATSARVCDVSTLVSDASPQLSIVGPGRTNNRVTCFD
ncbi:hypothetical protein Pelo_19194 [Pelomyxa schiedti]|nr:hypothetical protein Pelo_19194 [Pelomyxa schiedti]